MRLSSYHNVHGIKLNMNRINASFYYFEQVAIFNEGKAKSLRWNRRPIIITNHNQLFHFSDPSKSFYA